MCSSMVYDGVSSLIIRLLLINIFKKELGQLLYRYKNSYSTVII